MQINATHTFMHRPTHTVLIICPLEMWLSHNTCYLPRLMNSVFLLMILLSQKDGVRVCVCAGVTYNLIKAHYHLMLCWYEGAKEDLEWMCMCAQKCFNWVCVCLETKQYQNLYWHLQLSVSTKVFYGINLPLLGFDCQIVLEISTTTPLWRQTRNATDPQLF